ncbi:MAG: DUF202 domain-containing protein [Nodosilinea sp.]
MLTPYPPNAQAELARERNRIAADRSLLSFVRNSLTLISTGVGTDQISRVIAPPRFPYLDAWAYVLSLVFIGLGVLNLTLAALDYQGEMTRLKQPEYYFTPRRSLGWLTGVVVLASAIVAFGWLGLRVLIS